MTTLPTDVNTAVRGRWPHRGSEWSRALPAELGDLCTEFAVTPRRTYAARFAFVVRAVTRSGAVLVLRSSPDPDARHHTSVLRRLSDVGLAPRLHASRTTATATWTVSDAVEPGTALRDARPEQLDRAGLVSVLRTLSKDHAGPADAPDLVPWIRSRLTSPPLDDLPPGCVAAPEPERRAALDLLDAIEPVPAAMLCHGDLSPGNALIGHGRLWLIDPRGVNGEPAYDIAVAALKSCDDDPVRARPITAKYAEAADADPNRAVRWLPIAAAARV